MTQTISRQSPQDRVPSCQRLAFVALSTVLFLVLLPTHAHAQIATERPVCGSGEGATLHGVDVAYIWGHRVTLCAQQLEAGAARTSGSLTVASLALSGQVLAVRPPTADDVNHTWCVQYDYGDREDLKGKHAIWWIRDVGDGVSALDQILIMQFDIGTWTCASPPRFVSGASLDPSACVHMDDFVRGNPHAVGAGCFFEIDGGDFVGTVP